MRPKDTLLPSQDFNLAAHSPLSGYVKGSSGESGDPRPGSVVTCKGHSPDPQIGYERVDSRSMLKRFDDTHDLMRVT